VRSHSINRWATTSRTAAAAHRHRATRSRRRAGPPRGAPDPAAPSTA
jgi:hypothetical protein